MKPSPRQPSGTPATPSTLPPKPLAGKNVLVGVSGSIAAYKAPTVVRLLLEMGASVRTILTRGGAQFVGAATFSGITRKPVLDDMFGPNTTGELHVSLAEESDALVLVPATADLLARLATGRADDLLTATALCATCPICVAPAMHPSMWDHPATQRNVATLASDDRVRFVGPVVGEVASGAVGRGRMSEPDTIARAVLATLSPKDLSHRRIVVTAGPTVEDVDPVRFLSNRSSGKMGFAIAERAAARGARVTLVSGPVSLPAPASVRRVDVRSAAAMREAIWEALGSDLSRADVLVMAAAVGDYRPRETRSEKMKRGTDSVSLELEQNPDILAEIGAARGTSAPLLVGFAVETGSDDDLVKYARAKLLKKRVDVVIANHVGESMGREDNRVTLVTAKRNETWPTAPKWRIADRILDWVVQQLDGAV